MGKTIALTLKVVSPFKSLSFLHLYNPEISETTTQTEMRYTPLDSTWSEKGGNLKNFNSDKDTPLISSLSERVGKIMELTLFLELVLNGTFVIIWGRFAFVYKSIT